MSSSATEDITAVGADGVRRAPKVALRRWFDLRSPNLVSSCLVATRILCALCLVCAVLPLLQIVGDGPRGFEIRPVLTASMRLPVTDAGSRTAGTALDVDDLHEDVVPPRAASVAARGARRPVLPHLDAAFRTRAGSPPDRPPRPVAVG